MNRYMVVSKEEWEDNVTDLGVLYDNKQEAVDHAIEEWGSRVGEMLLVEISQVYHIEHETKFTPLTEGESNE